MSEGISLSDLSPYARHLATESLKWSEGFWDPDSALLWSHRQDGAVLMVRNSVWFAVGLLLRNRGDDVEQACRTIDAIIDNQFDEPGTPYHGTFYRYVGEPHPSEGDAVMWRAYDPNWRQFIGLGFATVLEEYEDRLPRRLIDRMIRSLEMAVVGEPPDRCPPTYSNIALMKAAMCVWVGKRIGNDEMVLYGEEFGGEVYRLFAQNNAFAEYNSPTYYGVNLYALGFWRRYLENSALHELGAYMEAELWRDIARYYHAGLGNFCGPFSRSYGMDMKHYTALTSLHIWLAFGREMTPFPGGEEINAEFNYGPCLAILGVDAPSEIAAAFSVFEGPRGVEKRITTEPERVATAWLDEHYMIGAEDSGGYSGRNFQYHPATIHWRMSDGETGWLALRHIGQIAAKAELGRLSIEAEIKGEQQTEAGHPREFVFEIFSPNVAVFEEDVWRLDGLDIGIETDIAQRAVEITGTTAIVRFTATTDQSRIKFDLSIA